MITGRGGRRISHRVPGTLQILICPRFSRISIFQVGHRVETLRNYRCGVELWYLTVISGHHQQTLNSTEGWRFNWCNGFDEIWSVFWRNNQLFYLVNVNIIWIIRTRPTHSPPTSLSPEQSEYQMLVTRPCQRQRRERQDSSPVTWDIITAGNARLSRKLDKTV